MRNQKETYFADALYLKGRWFTINKPAKYLLAWLVFAFLLPGTAQSSDPKPADLIRSYNQLREKNDLESAGWVALRLGKMRLTREYLNYQEALHYLEEAQKLGEQTGSLKLQADALLSLGNHYSAVQNEKSLEMYQRANDIYLKAGMPNMYLATFVKGGEDLYKMKRYSQAISLFEKAMKYHKENPQVTFIDKVKAYRILLAAYQQLGDTKNANRIKREMGGGVESLAKIQANELSATEEEIERLLRDSLNLSREEINSLKLKKKEIEVELTKLQIENQEKDAELIKQLEMLDAVQLRLRVVDEIRAKQQAIIIGAVLGFLLVLVVIGLLLRANSIRRKHNNKLREINQKISLQKEELEAQKIKIEDQHKKLAIQSDRLRQEVDKADKLLLNILPAKIAAELKEKGKVIPREFDEVTVMFTDFKGFTKIAEKMSPQALVEELDYCFQRFDEIVEEYGLEKIKTIGDAYMCMAGTPGTNPDHAFATVMAGLKMQEVIQERKDLQAYLEKPHFELRVGIHTGPMIAGVVGKKKFAYDIWGDTVNIASRMESSSEVGRVNISGATLALLQDRFYCNYRGKIDAKNKGEVDMYFINGLKPEAMT